MDPDQLAQLIDAADSALVTGPNLVRLAAHKIAFVSRCPENFGVVAQVKEWAWAGETWTKWSAFGESRDTAQY